MSDRYEKACEAVATKIEAIEEDIASRESEIEELDQENLRDEDRIRDLRKKLNRLAQYDEAVVDRMFAGEGTPVVTKRMMELERQIKRGLSWDEWAAINREYQEEAEKHKQSLVDLLDEAISA